MPAEAYAILKALRIAEERNVITTEDLQLVTQLLRPRDENSTVIGFHGAGGRAPSSLWQRSRQFIFIIWDECKSLALDAEKSFVARIRKEPILEEARTHVANL